jgi:heme-degrading monooxygenase HmoA
VHLVYFETTRPDHARDDLHDQVVAEMRALAESIPGFSMWRDATEDLHYWGVVIFETETGALAWRDHPDHARINRQSRGRLYSAFRILAFEGVREASFDASDQGADDQVT